MNKKVVVWLLLCLIWGSTWLFIKIGLRDLPPISFAALRFAFSAVILWGVALLRKSEIPFTWKVWRPIIQAGVLGFTINYSLIFWGELYISSGLAAVLQAMIPAFGLILAHYMLPNERMTVRKVFGVLTGIIGVGVIFSNQMQMAGGMALAGSLALFASAFFVAASNIIVKLHSNQLDPVVVSAGQMTVGVIPMFIIGYIWEGSILQFHWSGAAIGSLAYLVIVGAVIAFSLYYWLIKHMEVTRTMLISLVTPVIAVLLGMLTLGEQLSWRIFIGTALILMGIGAILSERLLNSTAKFHKVEA